MARHESDFIRLAEDEEGRTVIVQASLPEQMDWPPPEYIWLVTQPVTGDMWLTGPLTLEIEPAADDSPLEEYDWLAAEIALALSVRQMLKPDAVAGQVFTLRRFKMEKFSQVSDEDIAEMTSIARGALYVANAPASELLVDPTEDKEEDQS